MVVSDFNDWVGFGSRVKSNRKSIGLTLEKLAEMTDITVNFLISIEKGDKGCSLRTVHRLSKTLKVPVDTLLYGKKMEDKNYKNKEILKSIIDRCDKKELEAIKDVIVAMYPYLEDINEKKQKNK